MSGVASTSGIGDVTPSRSIALTGQVITASQESLEDQHGQVFFAEQGSVGLNLVMSPLTGQSITIGQGTISVATTGGDNVTVHISGVEASFFQDSVLIGPTLLTGSETTSAHGSVTYSSTVPLTGSESVLSTGVASTGQEAEDTFITSSAGTASPNLSQALTGSAITGEQGSVSTDAKEEPLFGGEFSAADGTPLAVVSVSITGNSASLSQGAFGAPGGAALTGSSVTVEQGFLGRSYSLTGSEITSETGTIVGLPGIVALVGQYVSVEQGTLRSTGTNWSEEPDPTTTWTTKNQPSSSWTRKSGPGTTWNRK